MQVKSIAECSKGGILQYFRPSLSYHFPLRPLFCLFLSGRLRQVLLYDPTEFTVHVCKLCREQAGQPKCPVDPFFIVPDKCKCVDFQVLKLQESPESVPQGEMPRHMQLFCDRYICDRVVPGNRVTVMGIFSIKKSAKPSKVNNSRKDT